MCLLMKLDCCFHGLRLFAPGNGSRKQNIFSSFQYTHSSWIIRFGYALLKRAWSDPYFWCARGFSLFPMAPGKRAVETDVSSAKIRQFRWKLVHWGAKRKKVHCQKFLHSYLESDQYLVTSRKGSSFAHCITINLQFRSRAPNLEYLPVFCCFLHLCL